MITKPTSIHYFVILVLVNFMWAFQFSGAKIATERLGPVTVTLIPLTLSTLILLPSALLARKRRKSTRARGGWSTIVSFLLMGTVGTVASQLGLTWGVQRSLASNAAVLTLTIPVLTAIFASILLGERMTPLRWISFALAIMGVLLVSDIDWRSVAVLEGKYFVGNLLIFASCLGSAFINSYSKKLLEVFSPSEVLVYSFMVADAVLLLLALRYEPSSFTHLNSLGWPAWLSLLAIALFSLTLSMILFFWVIERIDVTQASLSIYLLPVLGVFISSITLKEKITPHLLIGGTLVFFSTFLVTTIEERRKAQVVANA